MSVLVPGPFDEHVLRNWSIRDLVVRETVRNEPREKGAHRQRHSLPR